MGSGLGRRDRTAPAQVRCAVYTRKSTEEGLEQEFNSLDAQREAAEAYIHSQRHQGWTLVPDRYDDGGFSGGSLDRPALQRLLADIRAGRIDCVVVYKVDRLSRSLLDFARLMDQFDQQSVSFVAVTQQFNTTTSLGRLTLNVLLSFAQFEREIIGERTRDKMSAARKKGKWIGGCPVLGYDVASEGGRLVVNEPEAVQVRAIFQLYADHRSLSAVMEELDRRQWTTKIWKSQRGTVHGGRPFRDAMLLRMLTNPIYAGRVKHQEQIYAGEQPAIVEPSLWELVNSQLKAASGTGVGNPARRQRPSALLAGLLYCSQCGQPMGASSTCAHGRHYRYYVCRFEECPTRAVSGPLIEGSVRQQLRRVLAREGTRRQMGVSEEDWRTFEAGDGHRVFHDVVRQVLYESDTGRVSMDLHGDLSRPEPPAQELSHP